MNCAVFCPEETMTLPGTVRLALLLANGTLNPPDVALVVRMTVQVDVAGV